MERERRIADPTLASLDGQDVLVDWTAPDNTYLPVAHLRVHEPMDLHESMPADIACWFAVPCREVCFPEAPPPGRRTYTAAETGDDEDYEAYDPDLGWQVPDGS